MNKLLDALLMLTGVLMLGFLLAAWPCVVVSMWFEVVFGSKNDPFAPSAKELAIGTLAVPVWFVVVIWLLETSMVLFPGLYV